MELILVVYDSLCSVKDFAINGINADPKDFGEQFDSCPENAEEYGCGNMVFERIEPTEEILEKYKITADEYKQICKKLEEGLSFGACGWCV